ncbi:MAG TPA: TAXI family TRAP transporter solute-binding subunit [Thermomicrobiales bacterium]|nr:TAXI family TRAP transporter solute-binding subunit [Thermomicrobiales bacterium]
MVRSRFGAALTVLAMATLMFAPAASAQDQLSIATGGTGGVYFPYGGALASLLTANLEGTNVTAEATSASVDNMYLIESGDADIAFVLGDTAYDAVQGNPPFEDPIAAQALATLYNNYTQIVVNADAGISSIADLAGKRVSVGAPGSGTEVIANRILQVSGIDPASGIEVERLGVAESADAIRDGQIDAFFWSGGLPTAAITDLSATPNVSVQLLPHGEVAAALQEAYGDFYSTDVIPANTYTNQTSDVEVVIVPNVLVVNESMDEELAYNITRVMFEGQAELAAAHPEAAKLTLENATVGSPIPFHPGAVRYYQEQGFTPGGSATPDASPAATPDATPATPVAAG